MHIKTEKSNHLPAFLVVFITVLLIAACSNAMTCKPISRYDINCELFPQRNLVIANETIVWKNTSRDIIREIQFHLYANAFQNKSSTFMREVTPLMRGYMGSGDDDDTGWIEIDKISVSGRHSLLDSLRYVQPDDNNSDDRTVVELGLPYPIRPGATIRLDIQFTLKVPKIGARIGRQNDYYLISQWFPKLGVYEPKGTRYPDRGYWNCHQYHATGEFFSDFSTYDVTITVPRNYIVGATGRLIDRSRNGATVAYRFYQECVHDFAWTADPDFVEINHVFRASEHVKPAETQYYADLFDLPFSDIELNDIDIRLLIQPYHRHFTERYLESIQTAIKYYGLWYGPYPYENITIVDPASGAGSTAGMEYPTFFTGGSPLVGTSKVLSPELVTIHEYGHNYWYGLVASNEFEESWLDEGTNTFSEGRIADRRYGPNYIYLRIAGIPLTRFVPHVKLSSIERNRLTHQIAPLKDRIVKNSWHFSDAVAYFVNSYSRPALYLSSLERMLGEKTFLTILRTFQERYRYKHPDTEAFIAVAEEISGRDLRPFFDQLFYDVTQTDYSISEISSVKRATKSIENNMINHESRNTENTEYIFDSEVIVSRIGDAKLPVDIKVVFEDGHVLTEHWDGRQYWKKFEYTRASKVEYAIVDPDFIYLFDMNRSNNSRRLSTNHSASIKVNNYLFNLIQHILLLISSIT